MTINFIVFHANQFFSFLFLQLKNRGEDEDEDVYMENVSD